MLERKQEKLLIRKEDEQLKFLMSPSKCSRHDLKIFAVNNIVQNIVIVIGRSMSTGIVTGLNVTLDFWSDLWRYPNNKRIHYTTHAILTQTCSFTYV